ncbi:hypothetical protein CYMTET_9813 [Cymbomonas tetramitiformis]|uniref:PCI domain-containing protein n=1 Tax=Cymbomonas tetramitiformis TaxID=36881 RepID=A0AAE0LEH2_9CHLO|nr:hypothetical protein CYMTET_9813 [Cymbomonas tetramitiformis]
MGSSLQAYLAEVNRAVSQQNSQALSQLIRVDSLKAKNAVAGALQPSNRVNLGQMCENIVSAGDGFMPEVMLAFCQCLCALQQKRFPDAYTSICSAVSGFVKEYKQAASAWVCGPLFTLIWNMRVVAAMADKHTQLKRNPNERPDKLKDVGNKLMKVFRDTLQGAGNREKKRATLYVVTQLFKIYFSLNTLQLCKNLIKAVESPQVIPFENFPVSHRVTYKFYVGSLSLFNEEFQRAEQELSYALQHCHKASVANKRLILQYLVPVKLLLGSLPRAGLLEQHQLPEYVPVVQAMRTGNVRLLDEALETHQEAFFRTGTYLVLERLRPSVHRTLFKKISLINKELNPTKAHQLPLELLQVGLKCVGVEIDIEEVECILANLIHRKYVKGYISHTKKIAVLSKADAFPKLCNATFADPT